MTWKTAGFARHDGAPRFAHAGLRWCALVLGAVLLAGCASGPGAHPDDPLEPYNRSMTRFNDGVDEAVLKPVATAYKDAVPSPVRTGVNNFFGNLGDAWSFVNNVLQGQGEGTHKQAGEQAHEHFLGRIGWPRPSVGGCG